MKQFLLGLGGTGSKIVDNVAQIVGRNNRDIQCLCLDTDNQDVSKVNSSRVIKTSSNYAIRSYLQNLPNWKEWFPDDQINMSKTMSDGAGQIRIDSRLAFECAQNGNLLTQVQNAVSQLMLADGRADQDIKIMIVSSLSGGTGSGMVLQIPYYIRQLFRNVPGVNKMIRGLFIMPDAFRGKIADDKQKESIDVNVYAALREMNAMNILCCTSPNRQSPFDMRFGGFTPEAVIGKADLMPYNLVFFLDETQANGCLVGSLDNIVDQASEVVLTQLFSPIRNNMFSTEDNRFLGLMGTGGKNIYGTAGTSRLIYPYEDILRYCSYRMSEEMIESKWGYFDNLYNLALLHYQNQKRSNPALEKPDLGLTVIQNVEKELTRTEPSVFSFMKAELLLELGGGRTPVNRTDNYLALIEDYLDRLLTENETIADAAGFSEITESARKALKDPEKARTQIKNTEIALEDYKNAVDVFIGGSIPGSAVEAILTMENGKAETQYSETDDFSAVLGNINMSENGDYSLYRLLHPSDEWVSSLSARYLILKLIALITDEIKTNETELVNIKQKITDYKEAFDIPTTEFIETAEGRISELTSKRWAKIRPAYSEFINLYVLKAKRQKLNIDQYGELCLKDTVYRQVLSRLKDLSEAYDQFFGALPSVKDYLKTQHEVLENIHTDTPLCKYVMAGPEDKKLLYDQVDRYYSASERFENLVNSGINESLYMEAVKSCAQRSSRLYGSSRSENQKARQTMRELFDRYVIEPCRQDIDQSCRDTIGMDIGTILFRNYDEARIRDTLGQIYTLASPMLNYEPSLDVISDNPGNAGMLGQYVFTNTYWGVNPETERSLSDYLRNVPGQTGQLDDYLIYAGMGARPEITESSYFSKYEMICYNSTYGLKIEDVVQLREDGRIFNNYEKRINALNRQERNKNARDNIGGVITPHLDIRWHRTLPELSAAHGRETRYQRTAALTEALAYGTVKLLRESADGNRNYHNFSGDFGGSVIEDSRGALTEEDSCRLHQLALEDVNLWGATEEQFGQRLQQEASGLSPLHLFEELETAPFVTGLAGQSPTGINICHFMDDYQKSSDGADPAAFPEFRSAVDRLIREYCHSIKADGRQQDKCFYRIKAKCFETSRFSEEPQDGVSYFRYQNWSQNDFS